MLIALALASSALAAPDAISLEDAIERASSGAASVRSAEDALAGANARADQVRAARLPTLYVSGSVNVWNTAEIIQFIPPEAGVDCSAMDASFQGLCYGLSQPVTVREQVTASVGARVVEPLTAQLALNHQISAAEAGADALASSREAAVMDARWNAADSWLTALQAERQLDIAKAQVKSLEGRVATAQAAFDAGTLLKNDLLLAQLALSQAQQSVIQVTAMRDAAYARLGLAIGNGGEPVRPTAGGDEAPRPVPDVDTLVNKALSTRPDLLALRHQIEAGEENVAVAGLGRYPQINAVAAYTHSEGAGVFTEPNTAFVGLTLDWVAWNWGQRSDSIDAASAGVDQLRELLAGAEAGVRVEVNIRAANLRAASAAYEVAGRSVEQAAENLRLQEQRYNLGSGTMTELLDAESAQVRALSNRANALTDAHRAEAALARAVGADPWEF